MGEFRTGGGRLAIGGGVLAALVLWLGAYYATVLRVMPMPIEERDFSGSYREEIVPAYAVPEFVPYRVGRCVIWTFSPLHQLDRRIRPHVWNVEPPAWTP